MDTARHFVTICTWLWLLTMAVCNFAVCQKMPSCLMSLVMVVRLRVKISSSVRLRVGGGGGSQLSCNTSVIADEEFSLIKTWNVSSCMHCVLVAETSFSMFEICVYLHCYIVIAAAVILNNPCVLVVASEMLNSSSVHSPREVLRLLLDDCEATSREGCLSMCCLVSCCCVLLLWYCIVGTFSWSLRLLVSVRRWVTSPFLGHILWGLLSRCMLGKRSKFVIVFCLFWCDDWSQNMHSKIAQ